MSLEPEARVMSTGERLAADAHTDAAAAFVECAQSQHRGQIIELYVFGSTVRGETRGRASDVDVLVVLNESERQAIADSLRDIALNVMIEYGPVVELHILSKTTFERYKQEQNPFIQNVLTEGRSYI